MWFTELTMDNVAVVRHKKVKFKCGLIGIFGPNGCGKSTMLDSMYALVTNDFSRFFKGRDTVINHNSGEKEPASISGIVMHNQHKLEIWRGLRRPKGHRLILDEEKEITDANKIQDKLNEVLGVDRDILSGYVFKQQNQIFDFISATDAVRKKSYQTLCRAEVCEVLYKMLGEKLNKSTELRLETLDNSDELTAQIGTLEAERDELKKTKAEQEELLMTEASQKTGAEILAKAKRRKELREEKAQKEAEIKTLTEEVAEQEARVARRRKKRRTLRVQFKKYKKRARAASAALKNWENYEKQVEQRDEAAQTLVDVKEEAGTKKPPKKPEGYIADTKADHKQLIQWETQLDTAKEVDKKFKGEGVVDCPTCHTPVTKLSGYLEEQRKLLKTLPEKIEALEAKVDASEEYDRKLAAYEKWKTGYDERLHAAEATVALFRDLEQPKGDKAKLEKTVKKFDTIESELEPMGKRVHSAERQLTSKSTRLQSAKERLVEIESGLADADVDPELLARVKQRNEEHEAAEQEVSRLEGRIEAKIEAIKEKKKELEALTVKLKRNKRQRKLVKVLERSREVVHYENLPAQVSQANLALMEFDINKNLASFDDPFWVEPDDNLQFIVHKPGEPPQFAQQLSTGLRVVLAIPFWLSVASLWKTGIGMLALDEPTANLDEENRTYLAEALGGLTRKLRGSQQILMTTHADELKPSFDQVIELEYDRAGED